MSNVFFDKTQSLFSVVKTSDGRTAITLHWLLNLEDQALITKLSHKVHNMLELMIEIEKLGSATQLNAGPMFDLKFLYSALSLDLQSMQDAGKVLELIEDFNKVDVDNPFSFQRFLIKYPLELLLKAKDELNLTQILLQEDFSFSPFFNILHQLTTADKKEFTDLLQIVETILSILGKPLPASINKADFKSIIEFICTAFPEILPYKNILMLKNALEGKDVKKAHGILMSMSPEERYRALTFKEMLHFVRSKNTYEWGPVIEIDKLMMLDPILLEYLIRGLSKEQMTHAMQKLRYSGFTVPTPQLVALLHGITTDRIMLRSMQILMPAIPIETVKQILLSEKRGPDGKKRTELEVIITRLTDDKLPASMKPLAPEAIELLYKLLPSEIEDILVQQLMASKGNPDFNYPKIILTSKKVQNALEQCKVSFEAKKILDMQKHIEAKKFADLAGAESSMNKPRLQKALEHFSKKIKPYLDKEFEKRGKTYEERREAIEREIRADILEQIKENFNFILESIKNKLNADIEENRAEVKKISEDTSKLPDERLKLVAKCNEKVKELQAIQEFITTHHMQLINRDKGTLESAQKLAPQYFTAANIKKMTTIEGWVWKTVLDKIGGKDDIAKRVEMPILDALAIINKEQKALIEGNSAALAKLRPYLISTDDTAQIAWRCLDPKAPVRSFPHIFVDPTKTWGNGFVYSDLVMDGEKDKGYAAQTHKAREHACYYYLAAKDSKYGTPQQRKERLHLFFMGLAQCHRFLHESTDIDDPSCLEGSLPALANTAQGHPELELPKSLQELVLEGTQNIIAKKFREILTEFNKNPVPDRLVKLYKDKTTLYKALVTMGDLNLSTLIDNPDATVYPAEWLEVRKNFIDHCRHSGAEKELDEFLQSKIGRPLNRRELDPAEIVNVSSSLANQFRMQLGFEAILGNVRQSDIERFVSQAVDRILPTVIVDLLEEENRDNSILFDFAMDHTGRSALAQSLSAAFESLSGKDAPKVLEASQSITELLGPELKPILCDVLAKAKDILVEMDQFVPGTIAEQICLHSIPKLIPIQWVENALATLTDPTNVDVSEIPMYKKFSDQDCVRRLGAVVEKFVEELRKKQPEQTKVAEQSVDRKAAKEEVPATQKQTSAMLPHFALEQTRQETKERDEKKRAEEIAMTPTSAEDDGDLDDGDVFKPFVYEGSRG